ncbi:MAG: ribosomal protein S18-alanine N-acetyltransferase [Lachnospiraceae bacterium]|nr:ribosomal protein S18-alanine N-acetyltransferase [Lachnospiraceae bacterium]
MNDDIVVRKMKTDDIHEVVCIEKECFSLPWSEKAFEESLALPYGIFFVAEHGNEIAGYVGVYRMGDECDITNVAVSYVHRRIGIGKKLLEEVEKYAMDNGIQSITLEVRESNTPAINLYKAMRYKNIGIRKNFYEKPTENAIIMVRQFSD